MHAKNLRTTRPLSLSLSLMQRSGGRERKDVDRRKHRSDLEQEHGKQTQFKLKRNEISPQGVGQT
jgi:hypothetical protein